MKKLAVMLAAVMAIAFTGCGDSSTAPQSAFVTYIARGPSDSYAPHLYTLDEATQKSTAVAIPIPAEAEYIAANSDATAVLYCYDGTNGYDIFLMGKDGVEKELTTGADACEATFSPDGKTIAYVSIVSGSYAEIFTMNADGSNQKALDAADAGTVDQLMPQFSPDGKSVVFYAEMLVANSPARIQRHNAHRVSPWLQTRNRRSGGAVRGSAHPQPGVPSASGWYTMALTDTSPTLVYSPTDYPWGPAVYSADGKKLLLSMYDGTCYNISSVNLDGTGLVCAHRQHRRRRLLSRAV